MRYLPFVVVSHICSLYFYFKKGIRREDGRKERKKKDDKEGERGGKEKRKLENGK
jgi:hypothetical protein